MLKETGKVSKGLEYHKYWVISYTVYSVYGMILSKMTSKRYPILLLEWDAICLRSVRNKKSSVISLNKCIWKFHSIKNLIFFNLLYGWIIQVKNSFTNQTTMICTNSLEKIVKWCYSSQNRAWVLRVRNKITWPLCLIDIFYFTVNELAVSKGSEGIWTVSRRKL